MKLRLILQIVLGLVVLGLVYYIYNYSIMAPVRFDNEKISRRNDVVDRMKDIREVQAAYLSLHGRYCSTFDSLIAFVKAEEFPIVKLTARPGDSTFTNPIRDTVGTVSVLDSLFGKRTDFVLEKLSIVPYSDFEGATPDTFIMKVAKIEKGNVPVNVIEVSTFKENYLKGMDMRHYKPDKKDDPRFGSLSDPSTDGNWE